MVFASPRGWSSDPETLEDDEEARLTGGALTRGSLPAKAQNRPNAPKPAPASAQAAVASRSATALAEEEKDESQNTQAVQKENERLVRELHESRETEEVLMRELRRLRVEYNAAVTHQFRQQQHQEEHADPESENPTPSAKAESAGHGLDSRHSSLERATRKIMVSDDQDSSEITRLRTLLNQAWKEAQEIRERSKLEIEDLRETMAQEASTLAATESQKKKMSDKLADAFQEITRLNAHVQSQKAELNLTLSNVERSTDELVLHAQNDRKAAEAREAALAVELEQVKEELATSRQDLQNLKDQQAAEQVKNDQQKYEQFVAYRDLWKKNSFAFETLTGLQTSLLHALGEFIEQEEESGPNEAAPAGAAGEEIKESGAPADARTEGNEGSSSGTEMNMQIQRNGRVVSAVTRLNSAWLSEKKRREVAERNFSVCKKRLDRAMMQIESFQDQVSHLQASNALQESADVTFAEYEHWWNHFKHFQTPLPTSVLHNSGIKSGAAAVTGPVAAGNSRREQEGNAGNAGDASPSAAPPARVVAASSSLVRSPSARARSRTRDITQTAARQQASLLRNVSTELLGATTSLGARSRGDSYPSHTSSTTSVVASPANAMPKRRGEFPGIVNRSQGSPAASPSQRRSR